MRHSGIRRLLAIATAFTVALALPFPTEPAAQAAEPPVAQTLADDFPWLDPDRFTGLTSDTAAASCWEIKQFHPSSPSGVYWLLTPSMDAPAQFWCDQVTDGGGWVKVGQGRQGWEYNAVGRGNPSTLLTGTPAADSITTQLPTATVDQLLDGKSVTELADGVRVRRALNTAGSSWQEVRFRTNKPSGWFWTFGAGWPLTNWRVGTSTGNGSTSSSFGSGTSTLRVDTSIGTNHSYTWGFSYGNGVTGTTAAGSYLWTPTNGQGGARPFAEVYVRPEVSNGEAAYPRIPNSGTPVKELEAVPSSGALSNPWGVTGIAGAVQREGDVEVQDMVAIGNTMFVGGNFRYAQQSESGAGQVSQPFLAAFNATTGQFVTSFRPTLNEAVLALAATPNGNLAVGGKFTSVNGTAVTGFAVLNPSTGALVGSRPTITSNSTPGSIRVETITVSGDSLYLGGAFTNTTGPTGPSRYTRNVARIDANTMMPVVDWRPEVNGTVLDSDLAPDGSKVYFSGFFSRVGTDDATSVAALPVATPAALDPVPWNPTWSSTGMFYQRSIVRHGDRIYVGGSEHSMFAFDASTYERLTTHITNPKGDFQTLLAAGDFLYGGSHSNWFIYEGATLWPSVGTAWSRADTMGWMNAWRMDGRSSSVSTFSPVMNSRLGSGGWASAAAPDGTIWTGGDFTRARLSNGSSGWTGAFVRFGLSDSTAPNTPVNLRTTAVTSTTVSLAWGAPSGGLGGGAYQVLRDNRVIATTTSTSITVPLDGERRYFVRAADSTGNVSASSPVLTVPGGNQAPVADIRHTVSGLDVAFDGTGSTDDGSIAAYYWSFGDGATATGAEAAHTYFAGGTYAIRLTVVDNDGIATTAAYTLDLPQPRPADAYGGLIFDDHPLTFWRLDETSGTLAADSATGTRMGTYQQGVTKNVAGIPASKAAASFDGSNDVVVANDIMQGPNTFSVEVWFNTTTNRGGKLIGFGNAASGTSTSYDRHIYMQNDGKLVFGVYSGAEFKITSPGSYNNGQWHHAVGTISPNGMRFYVDGVLMGTHTQAIAEDYAGYWRVGGDTTWGSTSAYLNGRLDEAAVYDYPLDADQVRDHYQAGLELPNQAPIANFSHTADHLTVSFDGSASIDLDGTIERIEWDFGDGSDTVEGALVTHEYAAAGSYTVTLTVTDDDGEATALQRVIDVLAPPNQAPTAAFSYDVDSLDVDFDASASFDADGDIESWEWTFGDGSSGSGETVSHHYAAAGDFTVQLTVTDDDGDTATATQSVTVEEPPNQAPLVQFDFTAEFLAVDFDGTATTDPDGSIASVSWDFDDGSPVVSGGQAALTQQHTFAQGGTYAVTLTVTDDDGASATATRSVTVAPEPPNAPPVASFSYTAAFLDVTFDGSDSSDADGDVVSWKWDFGDDSDDVERDVPGVEHSYAEAGNYLVTLTVTDDDGAENSVTKTVTVSEEAVNAPPIADFGYTATHLAVELDASASTDTDGSVVSWQWNLGDGTSATGETVPHTYGAAGDYLVTLTVTDDDGASASTARTVTVTAAPNTPPVAAFDFGTNGLQASFDASDSADLEGPIASWAWTFGDGDTGAGETTSHTYDAAGSYVVTLTVTDADGAQAALTKTVTVSEGPAVPTTREVVSVGTSWAYLYGVNAPPSDWAQVGFNPSGWSTGAGPIGYGSTLVATNLNPVANTADRPRAVYFRSTFDVEDASKVVSLDLSAIGDDGVVVYVNGVEVGRNNMRDGEVTYLTYAPLARRVTVAQNDMLTVEVPRNLLVSGTNVIAAETHVNFRATPDVTFWATAALTELSGPAAPNEAPQAVFDYLATNLDVAFDGSGSSDEDGTIASWAWSFGDGSTGSGALASHAYTVAGDYDVTLTVTDDRGGTGTSTQRVTVTAPTGVPTTREVVSVGTSWAYLYGVNAPPSDWAQVGFNPSGWSTGAGPIGYGSTLVATNLNPVANTADRPRAVYFRSTFDVEDASKVVSLDLSAIGDDGVVVYVNGVEVGRNNMRDGEVTYLTYAPLARRVTVAQNDMLTVEVPRNLLVSGTNVIAAETHVNFRATPDVTFWATAALTELQ
ncbi:PKD domain-containing protein [Leucobacter soli]